MLLIAFIRLLTGLHIVGDRQGFTGRVEFYAALAQVRQAVFATVCPGYAPGRLNRRTEGRGLAVFSADHRGIHGVGDDLPPDRTFRAAADQADAAAL